MRKHTEMGARIIEGISFLNPCLPYIATHHEWWDGTGYPNNLKGEEIPLEGRILAVVDSFDAIVTDRPYRVGKSIDHALNEIVKFSGAQFDPAIVNIFLEAIRNNREKINVLYAASAKDSEIKTEPVKT